MLFFRQLQHLLPRAHAWRIVVQKTLRMWFEGIVSAPQALRDYCDEAFLDLFPGATRELSEWEKQFGLNAPATELARREQVDGAWKAQGGQSPRYLQDTVRAAGFDVYIHEWWEPGSLPTVVVRNPRDYTEDPLMGTVQCGEPLAQCGEPSAQSNRFLANEVHYLVNRNLTNVAPPPVPDDTGVPTEDQKWPYFIYWGGSTFGTMANVPAARRDEFERLLLKLCPSHLWIVTLVNYV